MLVKEDFQRAIRDNISQYPEAVLLYQAGDPRLLSSLDAIATMLALLSQQIEIAMMEPFIKVRDATVLADAALKGILPMATPAVVSIAVQNTTNQPFSFAVGRRLLDSNGRIYTATTGGVVPAGQTVNFEAIQRVVRVLSHTVSISVPFYTIELPPSAEDRSIAGVMVTRVSDGEVFIYQPEFSNVLPGDQVYNIETDEYRRLYVRFGFQDVVGYQPATGEAFEVSISECNGDVRPAQGSPFTLESTLTPQDTQVKISLSALIEAGAAPTDIATLRELTRYPSVYNDNAVFLGEFDFLLRRRLPTLRFLSVWNEQEEERFRPPSVNNINVLFVSVLPEDGNTLQGAQEAIREAIRRADDSYDVRFVAAIDSPISITVDAQVSIVNDPAVVAQQIRASLLREYGEDTPAARRGGVSVQYKRIYDRLRGEVPALTDDVADLRVVIDGGSGPMAPERRRFANNASITVNVTSISLSGGNWGN